MSTGSYHPSTIFIREAVTILKEMGFDLFEGPEVDNEWYNFDAINMPDDHPARDMQDTFWLTDGKLLRTQTSNCQIRYGKKHKPPFAVMVPGKTYRNEATDARHENSFIQIEGLYVDKNVSVGHLKFTLEHFFKKMFGNDAKTKFRPSFFPFVEPGFGVYVYHQGEWLELLGAGMVHPKVISNMGIDPKKYSGFAFGMGVERMLMIKYGIDDIRDFRSGDLRFLKQFS